MAYIEASDFPTAYVRVALQTYVLQHIFRLTPGHLIDQLRVGKGYLMVIIGQGQQG